MRPRHRPRSLLLLLLLLMSAGVETQYDSTNTPQIKGVSAMCSSDGITASIDFDRPFNGKIYSLDYATVHDCLYYNTLNMDTVLFSIPAHRCGTKLSRTTRNIVDQMVNRVYVQMDKDMQSASDKQFSFVCQLEEGRKKAEKSENSIRRHPVGGYAVAPSPVQSAPQHSPPIKPAEVRVSAKADSRFGNWPIPGAEQYHVGMQPVAVFPPQPGIGPVSASSNPGHHLNRSPIQPATESVYVNHMTSHKTSTNKISHDPIKANEQDSYPSAADAQSNPPPIVPHVAPMHSPTLPTLAPFHIPTPRPATPLPAPIAAQDSYVQHQDNSHITFPNVQANHGPPITPLRSPPLPHFGQPPSPADGYARPPAHPIQPFHISMKQGIGMGIKSVDPPEPTKVPAQTWNMAVTSLPSTNHNKPSTVTKHATVFREEPKRIGVEFTKDIEGNTVNVDDTSLPHTKLISTQEHFAPTSQVMLEIQNGNGPFSKPLSKPVKIGENITLVVRSETKMKGAHSFDMFVHSCFATDGPGTTKIDLIDKNGCVLRHEFVSAMNRTRDESLMIYFFRISAFKFPGPDDVYFSCSIDMTPLREAPEICSPSSNRIRRAAKGEELRLFDIVRVELEEEYEKEKRIEEDNSLYCASPTLIAGVIVLFLALLVAFAISSITAISLHFRQSDLGYK